jgi:hypothetical protein
MIKNKKALHIAVQGPNQHLTIYLLLKKATILSRSASVSWARVCMCMPTVFHCSAEKASGEGVLWQREQFSAQSWAPLLAATSLLVKQPLMDINNRMAIPVISIPNIDLFVKVCMILLFKVEWKIE